MDDLQYDFGNLEALVVERLAPMRKILRDILFKLGFRNVHAATSVEAAFKMAQDEDIDLIVTDWSPGLDGLELLARLRRDAKTPNPYMPVLIVTAYTETRHVYEALDAGMTEFLAKPVSARLIYYRLRSMIERQRYFVRANNFFGPDRRRRKMPFEWKDRRAHRNLSGEDRRRAEGIYDGIERRQGYPGYREPDRRAEDRVQ